MTLQQLEYVLAVARYQHFGKAADACFVTQPTLSMMIKKLEAELGIILFDRVARPIVPTEAGRLIIEQAQMVLNEVDKIHQVIGHAQNKLEGELKVGVIPTLSPYLIPRIVQPFQEQYPDITLQIFEAQTTQIIGQLKRGELDVGLLATPLQETMIEEHPLFYESFYLYGTPSPIKSYVLAEEIDVSKLLLLEEGHCLRSQIIHLCTMQAQEGQKIMFQSGSLETLQRLVEMNQGLTILPELAVLDMSQERRLRLQGFAAPVPSREISAVLHSKSSKGRLANALCNTIKKVILPLLQPVEQLEVLPIQKD